MQNTKCPFCEIAEGSQESILFMNELAFVIPDKYPDSKGHLLIIPFRHFPDFFDSTPQERASMMELLNLAKHYNDDKHDPDGYKIAVNVGRPAGQVVMHVHMHLVPQYKKARAVGEGLEPPRSS
jgi:diadenosine tetraphosphate (Ap4A) HIT family hydrolase